MTPLLVGRRRTSASPRTGVGSCITRRPETSRSPTARPTTWPGHTPEIFPNTEIVEFSPTAELNETMEVVTKNMETSGS
jgi:hypothetical protein